MIAETMMWAGRGESQTLRDARQQQSIARHQPHTLTSGGTHITSQNEIWEERFRRAFTTANLEALHNSCSNSLNVNVTGCHASHRTKSDSVLAAFSKIDQQMPRRDQYSNSRCGPCCSRSFGLPLTSTHLLLCPALSF